jgi:hypothetical protein
MRHAVVIAIAVAAMAAPAAAQNSAEQLNAMELQHITTSGPPDRSMPPPLPAAAVCPPGSYWVPAGYARHAKWRNARCFPG